MEVVAIDGEPANDGGAHVVPAQPSRYAHIARPVLLRDLLLALIVVVKDTCRIAVFVHGAGARSVTRVRIVGVRRQTVSRLRGRVGNVAQDNGLACERRNGADCARHASGPRVFHTLGRSMVAFNEAHALYTARQHHNIRPHRLDAACDEPVEVIALLVGATQAFEPNAHVLRPAAALAELHDLRLGIPTDRIKRRQPHPDVRIAPEDDRACSVRVAMNASESTGLEIVRCAAGAVVAWDRQASGLWRE